MRLTRDHIDKLLDWLLVIGAIAAIIGIIFLMGGCSSQAKLWNPMTWFAPPTPKESGSDPTNHRVTWALAPLTMVGGLSIVTGVIMLGVSRLERGWGPLGIGVGLCVLNAAVLIFLASIWFWITLAVTGLVALVIVYLNIGQIKEIHECQTVEDLQEAEEEVSGSSLSNSDGISPSPSPG